MDKERYHARANLLNQDMTEEIVIIGEVPDVHCRRGPPRDGVLLIFPSYEVLRPAARLWWRRRAGIGHDWLRHGADFPMRRVWEGTRRRETRSLAVPVDSRWER